MIINARLSTKDITNAIERLERFKLELREKLGLFVSELAQIGIDVIQSNIKVEYDGEVRNFGDSVTFQKEVIGDTDAVTCILTVEGQPYLKEWLGGSAMVNPLLMAEFGSGDFAIDGHKGEFPSPSAKKHTDNPPWFWKDTSGKVHKSSGSEPSRPLYKAKLEMEQQIREVAERVFNL